MKIRDAMTSDVETIRPEDTVAYAAARMRDLDVGFLPVTRDGATVGVVTDRDVAIRCSAEGRDARTTPVADIMTKDVIQCPESAELTDASRLMQQKKVRRIVVTNEDGRVSGLLSVDDLATRMHDPSVFSRVLRDVALGAPR